MNAAMQTAFDLALAEHDNDRPVAQRSLELFYTNPIIDSADMYKTSHKDMYPEGMTYMQSYCEARVGSEYSDIVCFGLQSLLIDLAAIRVTEDHITEAEAFFKGAFGTDGVFMRIKAGWQAIVDDGGRLPVTIHALPEGSVVPPGTPLFTIESTNPKVPWIASFLETRLSHLWYTSTVATVAFHNRRSLETMLRREGMQPDAIPAHARMNFTDFGLRGVPTLDAGRRGGMAALTSFQSSTNTAAINAARSLYGNSGYCGPSIPAADHSTITTHGKQNEREVYEQILSKFPVGMVAIVLDSYDFDKAIDMICGPMREMIQRRHERANEVDPDPPHTLVLRLDSGNMLELVPRTLEKLYTAFGGTTNDKGFKVLSPCVGTLQGDGITPHSYLKLLHHVHKSGFSVANLAAGSGGGLLQRVNRDTCRFAIKANRAIVNGEVRAVQKETVGKKSKRGHLVVNIEDGDGNLVDDVNSGTYRTYEDGKGVAGANQLGLVFSNGKRLRIEEFGEVRRRVDAVHQNRLGSVREYEDEYPRCWSKLVGEEPNVDTRVTAADALRVGGSELSSER